MKFKRFIKKLGFGFRIWRLFVSDVIIHRGNKPGVVEKLKAAYMDYYLFLQNTADVSTEEGKKQFWRAKVLREELLLEGENLWRKA